MRSEFTRRAGATVLFLCLILGAWVQASATGARLDSQGHPQILSAEDERLYRDIFDLQEGGDWQRADALISRLADRRLMGHVLFQRYMHPTAYRSRYEELRDWLESYADHPDADRIHTLAQRRRPAGARPPRAPEGRDGTLGARTRVDSGYDYVSPRQRSGAEARRVAEIKRQIRRKVLRTYLSKTERNLESAEWTRLLDQVEIDEGYARVAAAWLYYGEPERAWSLADPAANRSGAKWPLAHWFAGLAAWRLARYDDAARHFEAAASSGRLSGWNTAASAYWASRANLRIGRPQEMSRWLQEAAKHNRTFYGLMARRALGMPTVFTVREHRLDAGLLAELEGDPHALRAMALLQVGDEVMAERELLLSRRWAQGRMPEALLALTETMGLPRAAMRLGAKMTITGYGSGDAMDAALYPLPPWNPRGGWSIDRALVYAFMRQESAFDPTATSRDGARGLMQLMPATASYVSGDSSLRGRSGRDRLFDPGLNLELGQAYLSYLLGYSSVGGDLFRLSAAYNGGPGNLAKWDEHVNAGDDPLLFIEILPSLETRLFIERVLANLWIYRARLGQETPSLTDIASGDWPRYHALERTTRAAN